jgi:imidazole glycerol-phosphate synthase subunit HisF
MLRSRIIPCLLVHKGGLIKTVQFNKPKYVGDPLNAVRIFNEKEVDELIVIDVDATVHAKEPNYKLIYELSKECRMPLCYGGGIKKIEHVEKIISLGVEKVAISSAAITNKELISESVLRVGSQSVVIVLDVKKTGILKKRYEVFTHNGKRNTHTCPIQLAVEMQGKGVGEILINSIDQDGTMAGYDIELIDKIRNAVSIPITALGGAGSYNDFAGLINNFGVLGVAAGSLFVFKGKYRAVLINYPNNDQKNEIIF